MSWGIEFKETIKIPNMSADMLEDYLQETNEFIDNYRVSLALAMASSPRTMTHNGEKIDWIEWTKIQMAEIWEQLETLFTTKMKIELALNNLGKLKPY